ncbi:MAG: hypothetical protein K9J13_05780 [Saprospiraceae bacterium]|nr:hypothetical protein [Saprospiraceae bacterium]
MRTFFKILLTLSIILLIALLIAFNKIGLIKFSVLVSEVFSNPETEIYKKDGYSVEIWSQINENQASPSSKTVDFTDSVTLFAVINKDGKLYSDCKTANESGLTFPIEKLNKKVRFKWFKLEAKYKFYYTKAGFNQTFPQKSKTRKIARYFFEELDLDKLTYREKGFSSNSSFTEIDQKSTTNNAIKWKGKYVGTIRYKVVADIEGMKISSLGRQHLNSGDLSKMNLVHRISVKANSGFPELDMGFAMGNLPYYYGSFTPAQAFYGSDCAKFACLAHKMTNNPQAGYVTTFVLVNRPNKAIINGKDKAGIYLYDGEPIKFEQEVRTGDIIVISPKPFHHAGIIGEDINKNGFLDEDDMVLHTSMRAPVYVKMKQSVFGKPNKNLKILK